MLTFWFLEIQGLRDPRWRSETILADRCSPLDLLPAQVHAAAKMAAFTTRCISPAAIFTGRITDTADPCAGCGIQAVLGGGAAYGVNRAVDARAACLAHRGRRLTSHAAALRPHLARERPLLDHADAHVSRRLFRLGPGELFWMMVNLLTISVIYGHTESIAGWGKWEDDPAGRHLAADPALPSMGFFGSIFEMGRNVRSGNFDFFLAQPGNVMFMVHDAEARLDSLVNSIIAAGVVAYTVRELDWDSSQTRARSRYAFMVACGVIIHYSILVLSISIAFWLTMSARHRGDLFHPHGVFRGCRAMRSRAGSAVVFVYALPVVVVSNTPATTLVRRVSTTGLRSGCSAWPGLYSPSRCHVPRGVRRYASASS